VVARVVQALLTQLLPLWAVLVAARRVQAHKETLIHRQVELVIQAHLRLALTRLDTEAAVETMFREQEML
jgi:hypothetical protein